MRILVIAELNFNKPYGSHTRPFFFSKYLSSMNNVLLVLSPQSNSSFPWTKDLQSMKLKPPLNYVFMIKEVSYYLDKFKPEVIYVHNNMFSIIANLSKLLQGSKVPVVLDKHGSWAIEQTSSPIYCVLKSIELFALRSSDLIVAASEDLRDSIVKIYNIPINKLIVVQNGVALDAFQSSSKNTNILKESFKNKKIIILSAPRNFASNVYAIRFMYIVMKHLAAKDPNVLLLITGDGREIEPKPSNVFYSGFVNNLSDFLSTADLAVSPYPENAPCGGARNKVLEYFACKTLVVSTKEGMRGINGAYPNRHFILADDDPSVFADRVLYALCNRKRLVFIIKNALELVKINHSWENLAIKINKVLKSVVN